MPEKLKILFLSNRGLLPIRDGHTRRSFNILKGLAEKHQVHFLSFYERSEEIESKNIGELESFCEKVEFYPGPSKKIGISMLSRLLRSLLSLDPYTIWRHYSKAFLERVRQLIASGEFDLVHCDILPLAYTVRSENGILRSITDHDVSYLKCLRVGKESRNVLLKMFMYLESWKLKRLESKVFNQVNLGIAVSELDKTILQGLCPEGKFVVVENGVDVERFKPGGEVEPNTLVLVGRFDDYSNKQAIYYFLEKIYPGVKQRLPQIKLNLVGGGAEKKLKKFASTDPSIRLLGFVDNPLVYIQRANVFIAPILSGGGTRLKILEAMSVGKAIVTTSMGCEGIEGTDNREYLIADTPEVFAEKVVDVIKKQSLQSYLGYNARKLAEQRYDWPVICSKIEDIYTSLNKNANRSIEF
jgi:glycosyltransferase involved in cell wall biosynthesis